MDEQRMQAMRTMDREEGDARVDVLEVRLGGRSFALPAPEVTEVVRPLPLTPVPMAPDHFLGLGNIHGQIVCVVEPCRLLGLPGGDSEDDEFTRLVCLRHPRMRVAMRVDAVPAIHRVPEGSLPKRDAGCTDDVYGAVRVERGGRQEDLALLNTLAILHE